MHALFRVSVANTSHSYACRPDETLLQGMARLASSGIPTGCFSGGCGVCKIAILHGSVRIIGAMSTVHVSVSEQASGIVLACRARPESDLEIQVIGRVSRFVLGQKIARVD